LVLSILRPYFLAFWHIFKRTFTVKVPYEVPKPSERYRGRPMLHMDRCIGCGVCVYVCPNKALTLVTVDGKKYPQFNAGRCCFCSLCADHCPRAALTMTYEYELSSYTKDDLIYPPSRLSLPPKPLPGRVVTVKTYDVRRGVAHG